MSNFNFNRAILGGRLTSDVELKSTNSGTNVATFCIAVNRRGAKDGQQQTDFINCAAFKERAELISKFFHKGSSICVVGNIQTRSWTDNNGNKRNTTEVVVDEVYFVDSKSDNTASTPSAYMPDAYKSPSFEESNGDDDNLPF